MKESRALERTLIDIVKRPTTIFMIAREADTVMAVKIARRLVVGMAALSRICVFTQLFWSDVEKSLRRKAKMKSGSGMRVAGATIPPSVYLEGCEEKCEPGDGAVAAGDDTVCLRPAWGLCAEGLWGADDALMRASEGLASLHGHRSFRPEMRAGARVSEEGLAIHRPGAKSPRKMSCSPDDSIGQEIQRLAETALADLSFTARREAALKLKHMGAAADGVFQMIVQRGLRDPDRALRIRAAEALQFIVRGQSPSVLPMIVAGMRDPSEDVRAQAAWLISKFEEYGRPAMPALARIALSDETFGVRRAAAWSLCRLDLYSGYIAVPLIVAAALSTGFVYRAAKTIKKLGGLTERAAADIREALKSRDTSIRGRTINLLRELGDAAAPFVSDLIEIVLENPLDELSRLAVSVIRKMPSVDSQTIGRVVDALDADNIRTRLRALETLGLIGTHTLTIPALVQHTLLDPDSRVRERSFAALKAMPEHRETIARHFIEMSAGDVKPEICKAALFRAGQIGGVGGEMAIEIARRILKHPNSLWRREAAKLLGRLGIEIDREPIFSIFRDAVFDDSDLAIRERAACALRDSGKIPPSILDGLVEEALVSSKNRPMAVYSLIIVGGEALDTAVRRFVSVLSDGDVEARRYAAMNLEQMGRRVIEPYLAQIRRAAIEDPDSEVRKRAAMALQKLGSADEVIGTTEENQES